MLVYENACLPMCSRREPYLNTIFFRLSQQKKALSQMDLSLSGHTTVEIPLPRIISNALFSITSQDAGRQNSFAFWEPEKTTRMSLLTNAPDTVTKFIQPISFTWVL